MRLINADNLERSLTEIDDHINIDIYTDGVRELIENTPTVEAIPIEFIRQFAMFNPPSFYTAYEYGDEFFDENAWCNDLLDEWHEKNK